jgi:hypothetical protein
MISRKYNDFRIYSILEAIVEADNDFLLLLNDIRHQYAYDILVAIDSKKDIKTTFNGLQVSKSNNRVKFIPDSQFSRPTTSKEEKWKKTPSEVDIGRLVRSLIIALGKKPTDVEIEDFVNKYKGTWDYTYGMDFDFDIVKSEDIRRWYLYTTYLENNSTLYQSCMRHVYCQPYLSIYVDNPEVCSLVIMKQNSKLRARAILWTLDNGDLFLDRVYYTKESDASLMTTWVRNNIGSKKLVDESNRVDLTVNLKKFKYSNYPYLDTIPFLHIKIIEGIGQSAYLSNYGKQEENQVILKLKSTTGEHESISGHVWSKKLDKWLKIVDAVWNRNEEDWDDKQNYILMEWGGVDYLPKDEVIWSDFGDCWIPKERSIDHPEHGMIFDSWVRTLITGVKVKKHPWEYVEILDAVSDIDKVFNTKEIIFMRDTSEYELVGKYSFEFVYRKQDLVQDVFSRSPIPKFCALPVRQVISPSYDYLCVYNYYPVVTLKSIADKLKLSNEPDRWCDAYRYVKAQNPEEYYKALDKLEEIGDKEGLKTYKAFIGLLEDIDSTFTIFEKAKVRSKKEALIKISYEVLEIISKGLDARFVDKYIDTSKALNDEGELWNKVKFDILAAFFIIQLIYNDIVTTSQIVTNFNQREMMMLPKILQKYFDKQSLYAFLAEIQNERIYITLKSRLVGSSLLKKYDVMNIDELLSDLRYSKDDILAVAKNLCEGIEKKLK